MLLGIDVTSVRAWRARLARTPAVRATAFGPCERAWCGDDARRVATAWAVKEAAVKLLGSGFEGIGWRGVWSCPSPDGRGLEVGLGPEARAVAAALDLGGRPLRCALARDGDLVVALLVAGPARVAVRAVPFGLAGGGETAAAGSGGVALVAAGGGGDGRRADRGTRRHAARAAARQAGTLAARALGGDEPHAAIRWSATARGAPLALREDGLEAAASFAHDAGLAVAAVTAAGKPDRASLSEPEQSDKWTFSYTDDLGNAVRAGLSGKERR
jgi:phosphopantetheinyl transferase (holo-ACP synthase)